MKLIVILSIILMTGCGVKQGNLVDKLVEPSVVKSKKPIRIIELSASELIMSDKKYSNVDELLKELNVLFDSRNIQSVELLFVDKSGYGFNNIDQTLENWCVLNNVNLFIEPPRSASGPVLQVVERSQ